MDPSQFYTGLVADLYAPLKSASPDPEPYARFINSAGEPALELGCGDGEPLISLRLRGLHVEGLDASSEMLERCQRAATNAGVDVVLHCQTIQDMHLARCFRAIFLAGPTFNLLPDDETAASALARIHSHLELGGSALVPLFIPRVLKRAQLGVAKEATTEDGATIRVASIAQERDEQARLQTTVLRYERSTPEGTEVLERPWLLHWWSVSEFRDLASAAGFTSSVTDLDDEPVAETAEFFVFRLMRSA